MTPESLGMGSGEMMLLGLLLLMGAGFILFGREGKYPFLGILVIGAAITLGYDTYAQHRQEERTLKAFSEGRVLECGLWRGESIRVDPAKGWVREEGSGFVKGDRIIRDAGVCRVRGETYNGPSFLPYISVLTAVVLILMSLRAVIQWRKNEKDDTPSLMNEEPSDGK